MIGCLAIELRLRYVCGLAVYGSYTLCQQHSSRNAPSSTPNPNRFNSSNYTCLPGQPCWPSTEDWNAFNQSISGRLRLTIPWAAPCYSDPASEECQKVAMNYGNGVSRTGQYGSVEFLDWERCGHSHCALNSFNTSDPVSGTCSLGRLSAYHVEAKTGNDISKTLEFVRKHDIRVSIKNTGHDYFGRSTAPNSLAIWTHNMKDTTFHKSFQPQGCSARYENIGEIGAGIQAQEAWEAFEPHSMLVTVGAVASVGIAGGYGQGGGHGPLGPKYGLMVDQAVEFDVITADGRQHTINECSDPDLFWAMRGGGGGSYAVLTSYKFQLHPAVPINVYSFQAHFPPPKDITQSEIHREILTGLAANQTLFANHGIAGYNFVLPNHVVFLQVMPSSDTSAIKTITSQWRDLLVSLPGIIITEDEYHSFEKFSQWHEFTERPEISRNGPVGLGFNGAGRFIPRDLFNSSQSVDKLVDAVLSAMQFSYARHGGGGAQLYATGPDNLPDNGKTSVNPIWRNSLWEVVMGQFWTTATPPDVRSPIQKIVSETIEPFKALTPGGGCYMNEGDWTEENWQQTFFGEHYDRLLSVKKRYDPTGLFNCWKCVCGTLQIGLGIGVRVDAAFGGSPGGPHLTGEAPRAFHDPSPHTTEHRRFLQFKMRAASATLMALPLLAVGAHLKHGHEHVHADRHRRAVATEVVVVTKTIYTTLTVDQPETSSSSSLSSTILSTSQFHSITVKLPEKGAPDIVSPTASLSTVPSKAPAKTPNNPYPALASQANNAIIVNSCDYDVYVSSIGDESCGPGNVCKLVPANSTYAEPIRSCYKSGISLKVAKTKALTKPMQFEYTVWDDKTTVSYDISYLDCMVENSNGKDFSACVGHEHGIQAGSGEECPVFHCLADVECGQHAYTVPEFGYLPGAPVGACSIDKGVAFELCAENRT
ncbi:FAD-binding-like protein [Stemphylium lycopersici]|uniref:FAD-binding-like protein n=1 Tax=Stemphylium lycopersici TaxID=183478 RepID=A0A364MYY8_STELY|nr:FAD-binding-like protein [Stemphylium lycopersici]RAR07188.1 FAD-binding-like protein [Stemphylium lycopersici]